MAILGRIPRLDLQKRLFFLARHFVAGESIASALDAVARLNAAGFDATLDFLGENVTQRDEAERTRDLYLELIDAIKACGAKTDLSLKLTALGLCIDQDFTLENARRILEQAERLPDPFIHIDMEGSALTEPSLVCFERLFAEHRNVGPVIQAYLHRSLGDIERTIKLQARVRLCKGAYKEPKSIAYQDMPAIRRAYLRLAEALLARGTYPGIATHDLRLIKAVKTFCDIRGIGKDRFEFQMLYGIRPDIQRSLVREGYSVRVYVPFGTHWARYLYRRITERKENVFFVLRSLLRV
ncbi:MAG TPA: proline dehydrogenase family protein [Candidatus Baltobacteraceae bacterium]|jgi:proline dehydrogenase|nr:proline dehydrogenase family protein [Candidatus Baltobacteraceae bacterium]